MNRQQRILARLSLALALLVCLSGLMVWAATAENLDLGMLGRIRTEEASRSQAMDIISELCDRIGGRLTGSPVMKKANDWTLEQLKSYGLEGHLEAWQFGRGWNNELTSVRVTSPYTATLIAAAKANTPGTSGAVKGKAIKVIVNSEEDLGKYKGKLAGAIVLTGEARVVNPHENLEYRRYNDDDLAGIAMVTFGGGGRGGRAGQPAQTPADRQRRQQLQQALAKMMAEEKSLCTIDPSSQGDGGTLWVSSGGPYQMNQPKATTPGLVVDIEHYNRISRLLDRNVPVEMEVDVRSEFYEGDGLTYNTVAEWPGTDKKDEIVMLGAHLDSWHGGTGATDNASGTAVCMEALRLLKVLGVKPRRTIRIGLWSGEEQGLLGSAAYVSEHFASRPQGQGQGRGAGQQPPAGGQQQAQADAPGGRGGQGRGGQQVPLTFKPEYSKVSAYFNYDNGTGKIRGIYCENNAAIVPIFEQWIQPLRDLGMTTVTMRTTSGTDHQSFDRAGIPGFQFIQDPIEYGTRTHHSNMDVYERIQREDILQSSVVMAWFVYNAAVRDQMLPRKPAPPGAPAAAPARKAAPGGAPASGAAARD